MIAENKFFALDTKKGFLYNTSFISLAFDSGIRGNVWHRALIEIKDTQGINYAVSFYASDAREAMFPDGVARIIDNLVSDCFLTEHEKYSLLSNADFWNTEYINPPEVLLHSFCGRYLWVKIEVRGFNCKFTDINRILLYYPAHSFVRYLPEALQTGKNSFLTRFIAIFQSIYLDIDEKTDKFTSLIDPELTDYKHLRELAIWLKLDCFLELKEGKLRRLVCKANDFYKNRGTRNGILELLEFICDEKPYIVEYFQIKPYINAESENLLKKHYGKTPYTFTVIFPEGKFMKDGGNLKILINILNEIKPAHTEYKLIALEQTLVLDSYSYLGLNSRLSGYGQLTLSEGNPLTTYALY